MYTSLPETQQKQNMAAIEVAKAHTKQETTETAMLYHQRYAHCLALRP